MPARSRARKRALDILYAAELRGEDPLAALDRAIEAGEGPTNDYTAELVRGIAAERIRLDEVLSAYSQSWTLPRMPAIDRNVLRLGAWEILMSQEVPDEVAISEALALVRKLSTDESPAFVNGVLAAIARNRESLV